MNKQRRKKYPPLRTFTWSNSMIKTPDQAFVENTIKEWYKAKHPTTSED